MADPELSACAGLVRRHDGDRFLTALFAPADRREGLFALYAFNHEIAKTREVVSEPLLGQIRLQWWRDRVEEMYRGTPARHEVVQPLSEAVRRYRLDRGRLERLIDAREADLEDRAPATLDCLVNYADTTSTPLVQLALEVLGAADEASLAAGRQVGIAWALTGTLRSIPRLAASRRRLVPDDLVASHGLSEPALFDNRRPAALRPVVAAIADRAREALAAARDVRPEVPAAALPALLPATLAELYLDRLAREGFDPYAPRVQMTNPFRQIRLAWAALRGRW